MGGLIHQHSMILPSVVVSGCWTEYHNWGCDMEPTFDAESGIGLGIWTNPTQPNPTPGSYVLLYECGVASVLFSVIGHREQVVGAAELRVSSLIDHPNYVRHHLKGICGPCPGHVGLIKAFRGTGTGMGTGTKVSDW